MSTNAVFQLGNIRKTDLRKKRAATEKLELGLHHYMGNIAIEETADSLEM